MVTGLDLLKAADEVETIAAEDNNEVSTMASIFAGIGSGLIDIPKGLFSLGASIYDLTNDTNKAAEIEKYFDDLTNLDEMAEATAAGKITRLLTNVGLPGGIAFKAGTSLAELYIGPDFMGEVDVTEELSGKPAGTYITTDATALIIIDEKGSKPRLQKL